MSHNQAQLGAPVSLEGATVSAGGRELLVDTDARFESGEITLIIGPSGAGKSVLLRLIAGLAEDHGSGIERTGKVKIGDIDVSRLGRSRPTVGVLFQQFALFDELTARQNVGFATAHALPRTGHETSSSKDLLDELNVPVTVRTARMSGGQKQRLALARTLAYDPDVILYDEPTSGLDAATSKQVAQLIRETHDRHPTTSIIVTHDYESLPGIADKVYLFDSGNSTLREVPPEQWEKLPQLLEEVRAPAILPEGSSRGLNIKGLVTGFLAGTSRVLEDVVKLPLRLIPLWRSPAWGGRSLLHYLRLVAGPTAWIYILTAGLIVGFVSTYFTFMYLPYPQLTEPLLVEEILAALGFTLFRILVPVIVTVLVAARCGAAVASDVGGKVYGNQIDALRTFGAGPERYLLTGILYSFLIGTPLLTGAGFLAAKYTSLTVFSLIHVDWGPYFWRLHFHEQLIRGDGALWDGTWWLLCKLLCCAVGVAWISYRCGMLPKHSNSDVSRGITLSILWTTLYVLFVHFGFAFVEFE